MTANRGSERLGKLAFICFLVVFSFTTAAEEKLVDHQGEHFSVDQLKGKVVLLIIGFTNCEDICPIEMARATIALGDLEENIDLVQPIFLTVDPERDKYLVQAVRTTASDKNELKRVLFELVDEGLLVHNRDGSFGLGNL